MSFFDALKNLMSDSSHADDVFAKNLKRVMLVGESLLAQEFLKEHPYPTIDDLLEFREGYEEKTCVLLARDGFFNLEPTLPSKVWEDPYALKQIADALKHDHLDETQATLDLLYHTQDSRKIFDDEWHEQRNADIPMPGIQITLIRHGQYDYDTKRLNGQGAIEMTNNALLLKGASYPLGVGIRPLINDSFPTGITPDLIITSQISRAIDSGYVLQEQLKAMGINSRLQTGVAYLNEIEKFHHNDIQPNVMPELVQSEQTQQAIGFLQKCAEDGARHIVVVSHKPNVHVLGSALSRCMTLDPPSETGDIISLKVSKPENIGHVSYDYGRASAQDGSWDDSPYKRVDKLVYRRWMKELWHPVSPTIALSHAIHAINDNQISHPNNMGKE